MNCVFTIDVEDWFHILDLPSTPAFERWGELESRVERNFRRLLEVLAETNARTTCFFLGWVAQRFPHLVREAIAAGHEPASHGYAHRLVFAMTPREFCEDAGRAKRVIEDAGGQEVLGYRAPGFSVTETTPWFFEKLAEAGYRYDSSVFPATRGHGGLPSGNCAPYRIRIGQAPQGAANSTRAGEIMEFPIATERVMGRAMCFFGGGYLRLFPYAVVRRMTKRVLRQNRPVIFYAHPREIDLEQPRLEMDWRRRFQSYVNLRTTEGKIRRLTADFRMKTFRELLEAQTTDQPIAWPAMPSANGSRESADESIMKLEQANP